MRPESSRYTPFVISVAPEDEEVALEARGELDLASAGTLGQTVAQVLAAGFTEIVLDLRQVDFIDSTGLRMLLTLRNDAQRDARPLTLVPPAPGAQRIFDVTGTRGLFDWRRDRPQP